MNMKRVMPFALSTVFLLTTSYTPSANAVPRYGYEIIYYQGYCYNATVIGTDYRSCSGDHFTEGTLNGDFKYSYKFECSSQNVEEDQLYFNCQYPGWDPPSWTAVANFCQIPC